ncbi:NifB/NifX family molybdenum-iron cluster-binding protein [Methanonatronarchaeum sp. AMET-Sl]|uniref:NifB/NifX family molybdenum-iron cluster-binding protein n=1 Tax=Methanonatronarchaeum sp. AMET-Sl TaxID=3037654 RepID=UPI00244E160B|nr:NifB/NifX family molybdenum-iron cluster-binding protein [Methanonatronarchaeum sp. AMET-Sl]WGI17482.1 NifB/NifX family molybdenum-iron cluster-binding protein [Methanonatronarchaeum sp. AMET-Sl]
MKITIPSEGKKIKNNISSVFGRSKYFITAKTSNNEIIDYKTEKNKGKNQNSGAGITAAQQIAKKTPNILICKSIGPKAYSILEDWEIKVIKGIEGTVKENIKKHQQNKLEQIKAPTNHTHSGIK